jgi:bifunctional oligoribonuclease and PAP phosphatase NrnA
MKQQFDTLREMCTNARSILLTGPDFPDGDSIGACLALKKAIERISSAHIDVTGVITFRYQWMPEINSFKKDNSLLSQYDLAIVLDGDRYRLPPTVEIAYNNSNKTVLIDHHSSTDPSVYSLAILDTISASTCEIILDILDNWEIPITPQIAELIYTGLIFDTGGFRHSNTTANVHRLAARLLELDIEHSRIFNAILMERQQSGLQLLAETITNQKILANGEIILAYVSLEQMQRLSCSQGDIEGLIDMLVFTQGVEVACLCVERSESQVKLSFRSRNSVNVANLAKTINQDGGGHVRAAGAMINESLSSILIRIPKILCQSLFEIN